MTSDAPSPRERQQRVMLWLAVAGMVPPILLALPRLCGLVVSAPEIIAHPFDVGYPESALVLGTARLIDGSDWAYPDARVPPFTTFPYTPFAYALPALAALPWEGDPITVRVAGRALSWLALLATCALLAICGARATGPARGAAHRSDRVARYLFAAFLPIVFLDTHVRLIPQTILSFRPQAAVVLLACASVLAVRRALNGSPHARAYLAISLLAALAAAGFHQLGVFLVVATIAAVVTVNRWKVAFLFVGIFVAVVIGWALVSRVLFGRFYGEHVFSLMASNPWSWSHAFGLLRGMPHVLAVVAILIAVLSRPGPTRYGDAAAMIWLFTLLLPLVQALGKTGADYYYLLPVGAAAFALAGRVVAQRAGLLLLFVFAAGWLPLIQGGPLAWVQFPSAAELRAQESLGYDVARWIGAHPDDGSVVTDEASVMMVLGRAPQLTDPLLLRLQMDAGKVAPAAHPFLARRTEWVVTPNFTSPSHGRFRFLHPEVRAALDRDFEWVESIERPGLIAFKVLRRRVD